MQQECCSSSEQGGSSSSSSNQNSQQNQEMSDTDDDPVVGTEGAASSPSVAATASASLDPPQQQEEEMIIDSTSGSDEPPATDNDPGGSGTPDDPVGDGAASSNHSAASASSAKTHTLDPPPAQQQQQQQQQQEMIIDSTKSRVDGRADPDGTLPPPPSATAQSLGGIVAENNSNDDDDPQKREGCDSLEEVQQQQERSTSSSLRPEEAVACQQQHSGSNASMSTFSSISYKAASGRTRTKRPRGRRKDKMPSAEQPQQQEEEELSSGDGSSSGIVITKRTKRRPFFLELSVSLKDAHFQRHPWDIINEPLKLKQQQNNNDPDCHHQSLYDTPDFAHYFQLCGAFLLCTLMAVVSAFDAKNQCLQHETYAVLQLVDDDVAIYQDAYDTAVLREQDKCIHLFEEIILPTGIAGGFCALANLFIISQYNRFAVRVAKQDPYRLSEYATVGVLNRWKVIGRVTTACFVFCVAMLGFQSYNVSAIMLKPRSEDTVQVVADDDDDDGDDNNDDENENAVFTENPYQSLAAVDRFGQVGDNANLYYLSWLCEGLAIVLVYQVATAWFRVHRATRRRQRRQSDGLMMNMDDTTSVSHPSNLIRSTSWDNNGTDSHLLPSTSWDRGTARHRYRKLVKHESRAAWYSSLYRLRLRTGFWMAASITCVVIIASSQYIWRQVLWPFVLEVVKRDHVNTSFSSSFSVCQSASMESDGYFTPQLCRRTLTAWLSGLVAAILCATAIVLHLVARYGGGTKTDHDHDPLHGDGKVDGTGTPHHYYDHDVFQLLTEQDSCKNSMVWKNKSLTKFMSRYYAHHHPKRLPLRTELLLGILISLLLGINAILTTGVQGPAPTVGNLYYASWFSFLLCVRICLGCVEEFYHIEDEEEDEFEATPQGERDTKTKDIEERAKTPAAAYQPPDRRLSKGSSGQVTPTKSGSSGETPQSITSTSSVMAKQEKKRLSRSRVYFFLSVFATMCAFSAYDAGANQKTEISRTQMYFMLAPGIVAIFSWFLFCFCLSKRCYSIISKFWIGGILAIICFTLLLCNLLLSMHSEDSWAVNGIGEIEMANLYYFTWASIITSGMQMTSYVKQLIGVRKLDYMSAVWVAICKVSFVILGAALHIWNTISENCEFDEITLGAVTFCSRTVLAISIGLTGTVVGGLVVIGRIFLMLCPACKCVRFQAHIEMLISLFLVFLFIAAVALITGIGGPGQSVGDLYYSTWISFWVSLGVFVNCFSQLNEEEEDYDKGKASKQQPVTMSAPDSVLV